MALYYRELSSPYDLAVAICTASVHFFHVISANPLFLASGAMSGPDLNRTHVDFRDRLASDWGVSDPSNGKVCLSCFLVPALVPL